MTKRDLLKKAGKLGLEFPYNVTVVEIRQAIASFTVPKDREEKEALYKKPPQKIPILKYRQNLQYIKDTIEIQKFRNIKALITYRTDRGIGILEFADLRNTGNKFSVSEPVDWIDISERLEKFLIRSERTPTEK